MRPRNTLILALIFVALAAYVYFVELERAKDEAKKKTLVELDAEQVTAVTLSYPDREIVLTKSDGQWRLSKPIDAPADETTVKNLVTAIAECEVKKSLDGTPDNLAPYGLDHPHATVTVQVGDRELPAIRVGKTTPVGNSTYVQRADEGTVHLTGSAFHTGMDKQVNDLRDKQILTLDEQAVRKIAVMGSGRDLVLAKTDDTWTIERPGPYPADANVVHSFLSSLKALRATDFPADEAADLTPYGLNDPRLVVTLVGGKDDDEQQVLIGGEAATKDNYLKVGNRQTVYTVGSYVFRDLDKSANDFRDKTVLALDLDAVTRVQVDAANGDAFTLRRADGTWTIEPASAGPADEAKITAFLSALRDLKGYAIAAERPDAATQYGLSPAQRTIRVHGQDDQPIGTLRLGSYAPEPGKTEYTAARDGNDTVFLVRDFFYRGVDKSAGDLSAPPPTATEAAGS